MRLQKLAAAGKIKRTATGWSTTPGTVLFHQYLGAAELESLGFQVTKENSCNDRLSGEFRLRMANTNSATAIGRVRICYIHDPNFDVDEPSAEALWLKVLALTGKNWSISCPVAALTYASPWVSVKQPSGTPLWTHDATAPRAVSELYAGVVFVVAETSFVDDFQLTADYKLVWHEPNNSQTLVTVGSTSASQSLPVSPPGGPNYLSSATRIFRPMPAAPADFYSGWGSALSNMLGLGAQATRLEDTVLGALQTFVDAVPVPLRTWGGMGSPMRVLLQETFTMAGSLTSVQAAVRIFRNNFAYTDVIGTVTSPASSLNVSAAIDVPGSDLVDAYTMIPFLILVGTGFGTPTSTGGAVTYTTYSTALSEEKKEGKEPPLELLDEYVAAPAAAALRPQQQQAAVPAPSPSVLGAIFRR